MKIPMNRKVAQLIKKSGAALSFVFYVALCLSCAQLPAKPDSTPTSPMTIQESSLLPLADGWYSYDFERTMKGVEAEYLFYAQTGGRFMIQETTLLQKGTVVLVKDGTFLDPSLLVTFTVDSSGGISSQANPSVSGMVFKDGTLLWSGYIDSGTLWHYQVTGRLTAVTADRQAGAAYNGSYRIRDQNSGREQLVTITNGLYTWRYLDKQAGDELFESWPTLVGPRGDFSFEMEITSVLEMVDITRADYSTRHIMEGRVDPATGITMQQLTTTAGIGVQAEKAEPNIYSGNRIADTEFTVADRPATAADTLAARSIDSAAAYSRAVDQPVWYAQPTRRPGLLTAVGEKRFANRATALAMAEAVAASDLASKVRFHLVSEYLAQSNSAGGSVNRLIDTQSSITLPYTVSEQFYSEQTHTAWVLLEISVEAAAEALSPTAATPAAVTPRQ